MRDLLEHLAPTFPDVALLVEPPRALGLRVVRSRGGGEVAAWFDEPLPPSGDGFDPAVLADRATATLGMPARLSIVLDDAYFRSQVLLLADFPSREEERQQVLRWHIRKVLNAPLDDIRLRYQILEKQGRSVTLWLAMASERFLASVEKAFAERGAHVGFLGSSSLELFNRASRKGALPEEGTCLLINRTPRALSMLFAERGVPRYFRCKEIAAWDLEGAEAEERLAQEIRLTLAYQRERLGGSPLRAVIVRRSAAGLSLPLDGEGGDLAPILDLTEGGTALKGVGERAESVLPLVGLVED